MATVNGNKRGISRPISGTKQLWGQTNTIIVSIILIIISAIIIIIILREAVHIKSREAVDIFRTTKLTIKQQILAQNDQFNDKTPLSVRRYGVGAKGGTKSFHTFVTYS